MRFCELKYPNDGLRHCTGLRESHHRKIEVGRWRYVRAATKTIVISVRRSWLRILILVNRDSLRLLLWNAEQFAVCLT